MKALQLVEIGKLEPKETRFPTPLENEIVVRVRFCNLCRTDARMWKMGHRDLTLPRIPGHEIFGESVSDGRRVVVWPGLSCEECEPCRKGLDNLCLRMKVTGFHKDGGLAEYVCVPKKSVVPVPDELPGEIASLAEPLACGINALETGGFKKGDSVLIFGAGPVGLLLALAIRHLGGFVDMAEIRPEKFRQSEEFRNLLKIGHFSEEKKRNYDLAVNAAPAAATLIDGITKLKPGGFFCIFSGLIDESAIPISLLNEIHYRQLKLAGAYGCRRKHMDTAVAVLLDGKEMARLLISEIIPLDQTEDALQNIWDGNRLKVAVKM